MTEKTQAYSISVPRRLKATVSLPASKSISNRALVINALAGGKTVDNLSDCDDTAVMVKALDGMPSTIDIGAAGTAMRFLTALLAVTPGEHTITGTERMRHRPIGVLVDALRALGAEADYAGEEGFPPLHIRGRRLSGGTVDIPGSVSSQYISALLMVAPTFGGGLTLHLTGDIVSRPYIDLTLGMMRAFGAEAGWASADTLRVEGKPYEARPYRVESDWSAASYWFEMVAVSADPQAEVTLTGLAEQSGQGDAAVADIFRKLGVGAQFTAGGPAGTPTVRLSKQGAPVAQLSLDFVACPDLAQTVAVTCALLGVHFHFTGLQSLRIKETDRIEALKRELRKLGCVASDAGGSELLWHGERCSAAAPPVIDTYEDHRMAMAFAPAAALHPGLVINRPMVVTKSYPHFWDEVFKVREV